jgi:putative phosphoribosyl transferase
MVFHDRREAGRALGRRLAQIAPEGPLLILGLPRGGVPVAAEVAAALGAPLDVFIVRKLGAPYNPELAVGSVALGGITVYNERLLEQLGLSEQSIEDIRQREIAELERRDRIYRGNKPPPAITSKTVVLVDDGVATGATMHAAVKAVRASEPQRIIVAVPTISVEAERRLRQAADEIVALAIPDPYIAVGAWFERFDQLSDEEVLAALDGAGSASAADV